MEDDEEVRRVFVSSSSDFLGSALRGGALNRDETTMTLASIEPPLHVKSSSGPGQTNYDKWYGEDRNNTN